MQILSTVKSSFLCGWFFLRFEFTLLFFKNFLFNFSKLWYSWYVANYSSQYWHNFNSKLNHYNNIIFKKF